jgi:hypothetical protein
VTKHLPAPDALRQVATTKKGKDPKRVEQWLLEVYGLYDLLDALSQAGFEVRTGVCPVGRIHLHGSGGDAVNCTWFRVVGANLVGEWWVAHGTKFRHGRHDGTTGAGNTHAPDLALVCHAGQGGDWTNVWMIWDLKHRTEPQPPEKWGRVDDGEVGHFTTFLRGFRLDPRGGRSRPPALDVLQAALPPRVTWHALLTNGRTATDTINQRLEDGYSIVEEYTRAPDPPVVPTAAEHKK